MSNVLEDPRIGWADKAGRLIHNLYRVSEPVYDMPSDFVSADVRIALKRLDYGCLLSSQSALTLIGAHAVWDADIIARSVCEGTLKSIYILQGTPEERRHKTAEYQNTLPACADVTRHKRAKTVLELAADSEAPEWLPIKEVVASTSVVGKSVAGMNRNDRRRLESRWSFGHLAQHLAEDPRYAGISAMAYQYGMQSHLVHKDSDGAGMICEREERKEPQRTLVHIAHAGRIVVDLAQMAALRAIEITEASQNLADEAREACMDIQRLAQSVGQYAEEWRRVEYPEEES